MLAEQRDEWAEGRCYLAFEVLARYRLSIVDSGPEARGDLPWLESLAPEE